MSGEEIFTENIHCRSCKRTTNHDVDRSKQVVDEFNDDWDGSPISGTAYQIVVCKGCRTKSFRITRYSLTINHQRLLAGDDIFDYENELYPKDIPWHKNDFSEYRKHVPANIYQLYCEVLSAIQEEAYILAGIGLRGVIEGICKNLGMKGNLLKQIESLAKESYISSDYKDILHGLRFMGNDAAHDLAKPKIDSIKHVLRIAEHLIESIYILKDKSENTIEIAISDYDTFENYLVEIINKFEQGSEKELREWLAPKYRFFEPNIKTLESKLIERIKTGNFSKLELGKRGGKKSDIQFYVKK